MTELIVDPHYRGEYVCCGECTGLRQHNGTDYDNVCTCAKDCDFKPRHVCCLENSHATGYSDGYYVMKCKNHKDGRRSLGD